MTRKDKLMSVGRRRVLRALGGASAGIGLGSKGLTDKVEDNNSVSSFLHALGVVSTDDRAADSGVTDQHVGQTADGSQELGIQQQTGWNRFFNHGLDDLIPDTEANGGGCLVVYDDEESVKKLGSAGEKEWEESYETNLNDLLPVSEANGGGYLLAFDHELVRLERDGSTQWQQSYESEEMGGRKAFDFHADAEEMEHMLRELRSHGFVRNYEIGRASCRERV